MTQPDRDLLKVALYCLFVLGLGVYIIVIVLAAPH
jgi:hypothetical protein